MLIRETDLDDVLQINNVFVNVSKGEVAKHGDLQKAFGKMELSDIVKEVRRLVGILCSDRNHTSFFEVDLEERRGSGWREGARTRSVLATERNRHPGCGEMRRPSNTKTVPRWHDREGDDRGRV